MKIGDKVRFLSEVGGGRVAGFQGKNIVLVEDEDGFQVPMQTSEVVVIGEENYDSGHIVEVKRQKEKQKSGGHTAGGAFSGGSVADTADRPADFRAKPVERNGGDRLSAYLAFVPMNVKELMQTRFETYFVNDSNYYIHFAYMTAESNSWQLRAAMEVEPNMKVFVEEFGREDLNGMERVAVQLTAYKRGKPFLLKPAADVQLRVDPVKFYKLHTFQDSDFFEQPALVYTIVENDRCARPLVVDAKTLRDSLAAGRCPKEEGGWEPSAESGTAKGGRYDMHAGGGGPVVVDLHASELLDTTAGLSHSDILNYQLDTFRKTLKQYEKQKGTKIIFIHGKGEGVLRKALVNELQYRYKSYHYQDASFREYGYGATQVTIR